MSGILDIDECVRSDACGQNAICINNPGNYTCVCPDGYRGDPYQGVSINYHIVYFINKILSQFLLFC